MTIDELRIKMRYTLIIGLLFLMVGCESAQKENNQKLKIVATTGMIGDAVKNIVGDSAEVFVMMSPGVDPHLYKPTPRDVDRLAYADIVVCNGLHLEGKMADILKKVSRKRKVIEVATSIDPSKFIITHKDSGPDGHTVYDPHIWFDVRLWNSGIAGIGKELANYDSSHSGYYLKNLKAYTQKLDSLDSWTANQISTIPRNQRIMVTAHDAFHYFGKAYKIEVMGLQGISTVAEPGLKDISELVHLLTTKKIKAVFVETSVSEKAIQAVIHGCREKGHEVKIGGTLFSDAMGPQGTVEGTYNGMVRHNVETIVRGLK